MKRLLHILLPLVFILLQSSSCDKQDSEPQEPTLPPLTHEGKNTFGCKINGEVWVAEVEPSIWVSNVDASYFQSDSNHFLLEGKREEANGSLTERVSLESYFDSVGKHSIFTLPNNDKKGYRPNSEGTYCEYFHNHNDPGEICISFLDTLNNIISGTFEMDLVNPDCSQDTIMHITEGRFDVRY